MVLDNIQPRADFAYPPSQKPHIHVKLDQYLNMVLPVTTNLDSFTTGPRETVRPSDDALVELKSVAGLAFLVPEWRRVLLE